MSDKSKSTKSASHTPLQRLAGVLANTSFLGVRGQMGCTEYQVCAMVTQESLKEKQKVGTGERGSPSTNQHRQTGSNNRAPTHGTGSDVCKPRLSCINATCRRGQSLGAPVTPRGRESGGIPAPTQGSAFRGALCVRANYRGRGAQAWEALGTEARGPTGSSTPRERAAAAVPTPGTLRERAARLIPEPGTRRGRAAAIVPAPRTPAAITGVCAHSPSWKPL